MPASLILTGDHPAAAWLAIALARRGWPIVWADGPAPVGVSQWWGLSHQLFDALGEATPVWPLEVCAQQIDGLGRFRHGHLLALNPWPAALIDLENYWRDLQFEIQSLQLPRGPRQLLQASQARLGERQADWCLEIGYAACRGACGMTHWRERSGLLQACVPGGLLEVFADVDDKDLLALAAFGPRRVAFSYLLAPQQTDGFWPRLRKALPETRFTPTDLPWRQPCRCQAQLAIKDRHLYVQLPTAGLQPEDLLLQSIGWLIAQALLRWLSEELIVLDHLGSNLQSYCDKVNAALASFLKTHNFLQIPI